MAEKDITEKILADYNDVFADIVNVLLFDGRQVVSADDLETVKDRIRRTILSGVAPGQGCEADVPRDYAGAVLWNKALELRTESVGSAGCSGGIQTLHQ